MRYLPSLFIPFAALSLPLVACSGGSSSSSTSSSTGGFPTLAASSSSGGSHGSVAASSGSVSGGHSGSSGAVTSGAIATGGSSGTGTSSSGTAGSTSSAASTAGSSGAGSTAGSTGGLPTACTSPTVSAGLTLTSNLSFGAPAIAWGGTEGAVVVSDFTDAGVEIELNRFDGQGQAVGGPVLLGASMTATYPGPNLTVASNGTEYLACWDATVAANRGVACAVVPTVSGSATQGYTDDGSSPSVAFGVNGFELVDVSDELSLNILAVGSSGQGGTSTVFSVGTSPLITARSAGYAIAYVDGTSALDGIYLDSSGSIEQQQIDTYSSIPNIGTGYPFALSASGLAAAAVWYDNSSMPGVYAGIGGNGAIAAPVLISGTGSSYGRVSVAGANNSFGATWSDQGGSIMYVPLDITGTPTGSATAVLSVGWDDNPQELAAIPGGFMLATAMAAPPNATPFTQVQLTLIGCP